jgi:hypothetical protein
MTPLPSRSGRLPGKPQDADRAARAKQIRLFWMQQVRLWHWTSSALSLVGLLAFAATGLTLNHAAAIDATPKVVVRQAQLPPDLVAQLAAMPQEGTASVPPRVRAWLERTLPVHVGAAKVEWSPGEAYLSLARPGGEAWISIDRASGGVEYEKTTRGAIAVLNDLHKGRNTGVVWRWFIDVFAAACLVFALSGLFLLHLHAKMRPITWPLVAGGLAAPALLVLIFMHL